MQGRGAYDQEDSSQRGLRSVIITVIRSGPTLPSLIILRAEFLEETFISTLRPLPLPRSLKLGSECAYYGSQIWFEGQGSKRWWVLDP